MTLKRSGADFPAIEREVQEDLRPSSAAPKAAVCKHLLMHSCQRQLPWLDFVDAAGDEAKEGGGIQRLESARVNYWEICSTSLSIVVRTVAVYINVKLATDYHRQGESDYFFWTWICLILPVCATTLIHANM